MADSEEGGSLLDRFRSKYIAKLTVIAVVVFVVVGAVGAVTITSANDTIRDNTEQELTGLTDLQAQGVNQWQSDLQRQTVLLLQAQTIQNGENDEIDSFLQDQIEGGDGALGEEVAAVHYARIPQMGGGVVSPRILGSSATNINRTNMDAYAWTDAVPGQSREVVITEPYDSPAIEGSGNDAIAFLARGTSEQAMAVVVSTDAAADRFLQAPGDDGRAFVAGSGGTVLLSTDQTQVGSSIAGGEGGAIVDVSEGASEYLGGVQVGDSSLTTAAATISGSGWTVAAQQPTSSAFALANSIQTTILILLGVVVLAFLLVFVLISRGAIADVRELSEKAKRVAQSQGDAEVDLETSRNDEIGQLVRSVDSMQQSLNEQISERIEELEQLNRGITSAVDSQSDVMNECADGDLSKRMDTNTGVDQLDSLAANFNGMMDDLQASIQEALSFSYTVASASEEAAAAASESRQASRRVSEGTQEISHGTDRQSEELETIVQAMSSFSASIEEVASSANQLAVRSDDAADTADEGREAAQDAVEQLETIEDETDEVVQSFEALREEAEAIEEIVEFIRDVAEQTNMLALNANIEASRAGGEGDGNNEGFGVVAGEIKDLARDTQDAAGDIEERLEAIQTRTRETSENIDDAQSSIQQGTETIDEALQALNSIAEAVNDVNVSVQEIDKVVENQSETAQMVVTRVEEVSDISEANAQQAEDVAAAAEEQTVTVDEISSTVEDLSDQATQLADLLDRFTVEADPQQGSAAMTD
jgi:methyl-accepting chemotaxis protein